MPWLSDSSVLAREQHLAVSMTTVNSDFATNRFDRESVTVLVQGGSLESGEVADGEPLHGFPATARTSPGLE